MSSRPVRKKLPHEIPHWIDPSGEVYFVTINCLQRGLNSLCVAETAKAILESVKFRHSSQEWFVHLLLLMPDHLHALISFPVHLPSTQKSLSKWKAWTARQTGVRWQRDYFEHRLRTDESFDEKASYIRGNPVRAGLAEESDGWPWVLWADPNNGNLISGPAG